MPLGPEKFVLKNITNQVAVTVIVVAPVMILTPVMVLAPVITAIV